jgi:hypothetical protein
MQEETAKGWRDPHLMKTFVSLLPLFQSSDTLELSGVSLQALASAVNGYRTDLQRVEALQPAEPIRVVNGL